MAATFPGGIKNFGSDRVNGDVIVPGDVNDLRAEMVAVEALHAYQIAPSIVSNNLTLAIKARSGGDPSATEPVGFVVAGAGHLLTAALAVMINAGTSIFNAGSLELKGNDIDLFVYIGWRAASSTLFTIVSRIPWARTYADFSSTSTNEKYGAYSGSAPASTDVVRVIGRFAAQNSGSASFNWSIPTPFVVHEPVFETRRLTWTPTFTNLTTTSGTLAASYQLGMGWLDYTVSFTFGASSAISGDVTHTLPFSAVSASVSVVAGTLRLNDASVGGVIGFPQLGSTTSVSYRTVNAAGTYATAAVFSSTVPFTWTTSDAIIEWLRYFIS